MNKMLEALLVRLRQRAKVAEELAEYNRRMGTDSGVAWHTSRKVSAEEFMSELQMVLLEA